MLFRSYIDLNSLNNLFSIFDEIENKDVESYFLNVIERMSIYKDNFKSNNNITNCFLTFVLNDLIKGKNQILSYINPYTDWMNLWNDMSKETSTKLSNELDDDYFTLSTPVLATIALWVGVGHWNAFFDSMVYTTSRELQTLDRKSVV